MIFIEQLKEIKSWSGDDIFYKIEELGERIIEKCKTGQTENFTVIIERNMEHIQFLKPQIEKGFLHLIENT